MHCIPAQLAGIRVHAPEFLRQSEHQILCAAFAVYQHGCAISEFQNVAVSFPELTARFFVESIDRTTLIRGIHDHCVFVENRTRGRSPASVGRHLAQICLPHFFAIHVKGQRPAFPEEHEHIHAVRHWSMGRIAVLGQKALIGILGLRRWHLHIPEDAAVRESEADQMPGERADVATRSAAVARPTGHENLVSPHDGAG